jgi:diacylglycerol O-acyltransferase
MEKRRLSAQDALWLTMDRPNNLMVIDVAIVLAGDPGIERLRELFLALTVRHPVFASRAESGALGWSWAPDPEFDVERHVRVVELPEGAGMAEVQRHVAEQRSEPLDRAHPLWTAALLRPVVLDDGSTGSVVVTRFHHAIADGVRLTQVMLGMLDPDFASSVPRVARGGVSGGPTLSTDTVRSAAAEAARLAVGATRSLAGALGQALTDPVGTVTSTPSTLTTWFGMIRHPDRFVDVLEELGGDDHRSVNDLAAAGKLALGGTTRTVWTGRPGRRKSVAWSPPYPLGTVRSVARHHRSTVNDVLIAALAGAVRRYLAGRGDAVDQVTWMVPVNLKPFSAELPEDLGNHFALVILDMPLLGETPSARIAEQRHRMRRIKNSDEPVLTFGLQRTISMSPARMASALTDFFADKAVGILTNVPGPTKAMDLDGIPVRQVIGFAPCSGDQPLTATIFTYAGTVTVGFAGDADLVPDPQTLVSLVLDELDQMGAASA